MLSSAPDADCTLLWVVLWLSLHYLNCSTQLFTSEVAELRRFCYLATAYRNVNQILQLALHMVIGMFVPYTTIAVLNVLIVFQMIQYRRQRAALSTGTKASSDDAAQRAMTIMLVIVSSYSVIMNTPLIISWILSPWRFTANLQQSAFNVWAEQI